MAFSDISSKRFEAEMMSLSLSIIWKDAYQAYEAEPSDIRTDVESYLVARNGELLFSSVYQFHSEVLASFFPNEAELAIVEENKYMIPESYRDAIVAAESEYLINWWENEDGEQNAYYRMLFGLPPLEMDEADWAYNTKHAGYSLTTPLHLMDYTDILKLEQMGYLDELRAGDYSDSSYSYLHYMGKYRIYPYTARQADPFAILYIDESNFEYLRDDFIDVYGQARRMACRVYYTDAYRYKDALFESFIGMLILFTTQQRMYVKCMEADVTRDFYDLESLKLVYDAYGFPFYSSIPITYHQAIVKKMNKLVAYKGSTQVFYDVFDLFDFGTMEVFEYFLVKERNVDSNGNPIFRDADGNPLSAEEMWNLRFARVAWSDDKFLEIVNPENSEVYEDITTYDPYWLEDDDLKTKLYETDWNYFHSKYMGVQLMFELSDLIFQVCYFLKMLQDNREPLSELTAYYSPTAEETPIFDLVIYAVALLCENAGYTGEIPSQPSAVAACYGFNFKEYAQILKIGTDDIDTFVINFKANTQEVIDANPVLSYDQSLQYWLSQVTDGAFSYLGNDYTYDVWPYEATPVFIDDFVPTSNSIVNLKEYLSQTIQSLYDDPTLVDVELVTMYQNLVTDDDYTFEVLTYTSTNLNKSYEEFLLTKSDYDDANFEALRAAVIASYEQLLAWIIRQLNARKAMTYDSNIVTMIQDMNINEVDDVDRVYKCIEELHDYLCVKVRQSKTREEYNAYANMRKILMTTGMMDITFTKSDGTIATTYADMLENINITLYYRLTSGEVDIETEESYVLQTLMTLCEDITLLESANTANIQRVVDYVYKIIDFLKSAKVDLVDFQVIYLISDRSMNYIKYIAEIYEQWNVIGPRKDYLTLFEFIHETYVVQVLQTYLQGEDVKHVQEIEQRLDDALKTLMDNDIMNCEVTQQFRSLFEYWVAEIYNMEVDHQLVESMLYEQRGYSEHEIASRNGSAFQTKSSLILAGIESVLKSKGLSLDTVNRNRREVTDAGYTIIPLADGGLHYAEVEHTAVNDAIMMGSSLIKVSETFTDDNA